MSTALNGHHPSARSNSFPPSIGLHENKSIPFQISPFVLSSKDWRCASKLRFHGQSRRASLVRETKDPNRSREFPSIERTKDKSPVLILKLYTRDQLRRNWPEELLHQPSTNENKARRFNPIVEESKLCSHGWIARKKRVGPRDRRIPSDGVLVETTRVAIGD